MTPMIANGINILEKSFLVTHLELLTLNGIPVVDGKLIQYKEINAMADPTA